MDCIFCKIGAKQIAAEVIYEDENALAFLDIHPLAEGHTMVIPKFHAENILEVPENKLGELFGAVKKVTSILNDTYKADGFVIGINHGRFGTHTEGVNHLHVHVIPRFKDDGGGSIHTLKGRVPKRSIAEVAEFIRKK